jgi:hypothetical protein
MPNSGADSRAFARFCRETPPEDERFVSRRFSQDSDFMAHV